MTESRWTIDAAGRLCCYGDPIRAKSSWQTVADALNDYVEAKAASGAGGTQRVADRVKAILAQLDEFKHAHLHNVRKLHEAEQAVAAERERCAKLLEAQRDFFRTCNGRTLDDLIAKVRNG